MVGGLHYAGHSVRQCLRAYGAVSLLLVQQFHETLHDHGLQKWPDASVFGRLYHIGNSVQHCLRAHGWILMS